MKIPLTPVILAAALTLVPGAVFAESAAKLYSRHCSECHGVEGRGGKAPALNKEGLLRTVGLTYLVRTITVGRPLRGCPANGGSIAPEEIKAIALYVKDWQKGDMLEAPERDVEPGKTPRGEDLFTLCGGCHGLEGEGAMGPPLLDPGFLASVSDTELRRTIMWGRPGTPMKGYLKGGGGLATLTEEEIDEIIAYIRYREKGL